MVSGCVDFNQDYSRILSSDIVGGPVGFPVAFSSLQLGITILDNFGNINEVFLTSFNNSLAC